MRVISETERYTVQSEQVLRLLPKVQLWLRNTSSDKSSRKKKLTATQSVLLTFIGSHGQVNVTAIASAQNLSMATITEHMEALIEMGVVSKRRLGSDRRNVIVELTQAGKLASEALLKRRNDLVIQAMEKLDPRERDGFLKGLEALSAQSDEMCTHNANDKKRERDVARMS